MSRALALPLLASALAACARDDTAYPSLAPRPIEQVSFEEPPAPPPRPVLPDPALDVEVAAATARLDKAATDFTRSAAQATTAAARARGAAAGTESWIDAQTALAALDVSRAEVSEVLTDLDQAAIARAVTLAPAYPSLEAARARARDELDRERAAINRIEASIAPA